jgi:lipoprotein-anchoring transpeptidase ErfK/SrfK
MTRRTFLRCVYALLGVAALAAGWMIVAAEQYQAVGAAPASQPDLAFATQPSTTVPATTTPSTTSPSTIPAATVTSVVRTTTTTIAQPTTTSATVRQSAQLAAQPTCSRIDVDISDQQLTARCSDGTWVIPVSSGNEIPYCENGSCGDAVTPRGTFRVYRMDPGYEEAPLGTIYNGIYFFRGFAIHGGKLPGYPDSHGCVRVRYSDADWLFEAVNIGTVVHIRD